MATGPDIKFRNSENGEWIFINHCLSVLYTGLVSSPTLPPDDS